MTHEKWQITDGKLQMQKNVMTNSLSIKMQNGKRHKMIVTREEVAVKGWLPIAKLKKIYKDRLDSGVTWLKWLPHSMEQYGRLAPKSNKVNYQKLTLYFKKIHR